MKRHCPLFSTTRPRQCNITTRQTQKRHLHPTSTQADTFTTSDTDPFIPSPDGFRTLRRRRGDLSNPSLPIPPLLDPRVDSSRRRHESPRPLADWSSPTPMQEELLSNPFGTFFSPFTPRLPALDHSSSLCSSILFSPCSPTLYSPYSTILSSPCYSLLCKSN